MVSRGLRRSSDDHEVTVLSYDASARELVFDGTRSGVLGIDDFCGHVPVERAPFGLKPDEDLRLRIYVDGPVVEVFANDRQAICRRVYPLRPGSEGVVLSADANPVTCKVLKAWEIAPANPY